MNHWQSKGLVAWLLLPVTGLFALLVAIRKRLYQFKLLKSKGESVPVIVVGNISVGGTGKTPLVGLLTRLLVAKGFTPGIVSRGYGGATHSEPILVDSNSEAMDVGDEPKLLHRDTGVNVCVSKKRVLAVSHLLERCNSNVILSDDGLQHYAMRRAFEIAVVDGERGAGNAFLLPSGPLREPVSRLLQVDLIAVQLAVGQQLPGQISALTGLSCLRGKKVPPYGGFSLHISHLRCLSNNKIHKLLDFSGAQVHVVAGLGNPQRFFESLSTAGLSLITHVMPDHHHYEVKDIQFGDNKAVLITSKDAVKVEALDTNLAHVFEVVVSAVPDEALSKALGELVDRTASV